MTGRSSQPCSGKIALGFGLPLTIATCANDMAIIAVAPTTEPDDRSMPPVMITWVTPMAMMPTMDTCRMMISSRCWLKMASTFSRVLNRKLSPIRSRPRISNVAAMTMSAMRMFISGGHVRLDLSKVRPPTPWVVCATLLPPPLGRMWAYMPGVCQA